MFKKYRFDILLISSLIVVSLIAFGVLQLTAKKDNLIAYIYYEGELYDTIDLNKEEESRFIYIDSNHIVIEVKNKAIRILENDCPSQYCVNQGWSTSTAKPLICVYHNLYIKIISNSDIDVVTG